MNEDGGKDRFPLLQHFMVSKEVDFSHNLKSGFEDHLSQIIQWFEEYFQEDDINKFAWIQDPFRVKAPSEFTSTEEESLELYCYNTLKVKFGSMELTDFGFS
ncbi:Hypothetical predicted protein, partial [Pelobates cultripes]